MKRPPISDQDIHIFNQGMSNFLTSLSWSLSHFEFPQKQTLRIQVHMVSLGASQVALVVKNLPAMLET